MNPVDDIEEELKKQKEATKQEKERRLVNELKETIGGLFENQKYRIEIKRVALDDHLSFSGMRNSRLSWIHRSDMDSLFTEKKFARWSFVEVCAPDA